MGLGEHPSARTLPPAPAGGLLILYPRFALADFRVFCLD
jgi:hypothetical protein